MVWTYVKTAPARYSGELSMMPTDSSEPGPPTAELSRTVLAVDDEPSILEWLSRSLDEFGFDVIKAGDPSAAHNVLQTSKVDAVILDVRLVRGSGLDILESLRMQEPLASLPVIILTGVAQLTPSEEELIRRHQAYVFYKPEGIAPIAEKLDELLRR
jgi:DNA-binding response OmpR family regulator